MNTEPDTTQGRQKSKKGGCATRAFSGICLLSSIILLCITHYAFQTRDFNLAAITVWPFWMWMFIGIFFLALGRRSGCCLWSLVLLLWLAGWYGHGEEVQGFLNRTKPETKAWLSARKKGESIRVVTVNCAVGNARVAEQAARLRPDILLLQESPGPSQLTKAVQLMGKGATVAWTPDASVITRGRMQIMQPPEGAPFGTSIVVVWLPDGSKANVVSLRLLSATIRSDLWNRKAWEEHKRNRLYRNGQLESIEDYLKTLPRDEPLIVAGDFNVPAHDRVFAHLKPYCKDTWETVGSGYPHTILNNLPLHRIDQVWTNGQFLPNRTVARITTGSDHRMVICDLLLKKSRSGAR